MGFHHRTNEQTCGDIRTIIQAFLSFNPILNDIVSEADVRVDNIPVGLEPTGAFIVRLRLEKYDKTCMFRILDVQLERLHADDDVNDLAGWIWNQCLQALWDTIIPVRSAVPV